MSCNPRFTCVGPRGILFYLITVSCCSRVQVNEHPQDGTSTRKEITETNHPSQFPKGQGKFTAISIAGRPPYFSLASWPLGATTLLTLALYRNHQSALSLWYLTVSFRGQRRALWRTLWRPEGLWALQAVSFASTTATTWGGTVSHRVRASMHHDCIHAIGHGERLEVGLDGHREGKFVNEVHRCAGDDRTAAQILQTEDCGNTGIWMSTCQRSAVLIKVFHCIHQIY